MDIRESGAVAGRDVVQEGTNVAGRDVVIHHQTVYSAVAPTVLPRELPPEVANFVDRQDATDALHRALDSAADAGHVPIATVCGPPGVGKTALALRVAHRLTARFGDGILFINLTGQQSAPLEPAGVLGEFLLALGAERIPDTLEARSRAYRSLLAAGRYLVVLDNARDERQLRSLLPGAPGSGVLVTSRRRLALPESTVSLSLEAFDETSGLELLSRLAGDQRVGTQGTQARQIIMSCGGLPLALRIAGARLASRPHWKLERLAGRLADERRRLEELDMGDDEVRAGFTAAYEGLDDDARRMFRRLGALDMLDFPGWLPAVLLDADPDDAEDMADQLVEAHLLQVADSTGELRYSLHDLLRAFARERLAAGEPDEAGAALDRTLAAYLLLALRADAGFSAANSAAWDDPDPNPELERRLAADTADPQAWFSTERANLLRLMDQASRAGRHRQVWRLAGSLWQFLEVTGRWGDWSVACTLGADAARAAGDPIAESACTRLLGRLELSRGDTTAAGALLDRALALLAPVDYLHGECMIRKDMSVAERLHHRHRAASELLVIALAGFRRLEENYWVAIVGRELGIEYRYLGEWADAESQLAHATATFAAMGESLQEAQTLFEIGVLRRTRGDWAAASESFARAVPAAERLDARGLLAWIVRETALVAAGRGEPAAAVRLLEDALQRWRSLEDWGQYGATEHELALAHRQNGDPAPAVDAARHAVETLHRAGSPVNEARALVTLAELYVRTGDAAAAVATGQQALPLLRANDDAFWEVKAQRALADGYAALGDERSARDAAVLAEGLARYVPEHAESRV